MTAMLRPKVGVLALTLELYESLAPKVRGEREEWVRRAVVPALERALTTAGGGCAAPAADVVFGGAVNTREKVDAAVAGMEATGVDGIVVLLLTYAPSQIALPALSRTRLPILVWNTQELLGVTPEFGGAELTANHGVHGTQDLCNVLLRSGVRFEYVTSHLSDVDATRGVVGVGSRAVFLQESSASAQGCGAEGSDPGLASRNGAPLRPAAGPGPFDGGDHRRGPRAWTAVLRGRSRHRLRADGGFPPAAAPGSLGRQADGL